MLNLRVVQARYGDCLIVESGIGKSRKNILIDGGPKDVFGPHLRQELARIAGEGGQVDLMVLSHVDNDHVIGLLELMRELRDARQRGEPDLVCIRRIWHNAYQQILPEAGPEADLLETEVLMRPVGLAAESDLPAASDPAANDLAANDPPAAELPEDMLAAGEPEELDPEVSFGIGEGVKLQLADELLNIPRNAGFRSGLVTLEQSRRPERIGSTRLWVLGPSQSNLDNLREKWMGWLDVQAGRISFEPGTPVVEPDDSINNLSSILLLAGWGRKRILLTGDGRSQDIIQGLEQAGLLEPGGVCRVNVMKVPHHGSTRNAVGELFERVQADSYVFSANGLHGNPDWQTLVWLLDAVERQGRSVRLYATNWTKSLRRLVAERPPETNRYTLTVLEPGQSSLVVTA